MGWDSRQEWELCLVGGNADNVCGWVKKSTGKFSHDSDELFFIVKDAVDLRDDGCICSLTKNLTSPFYNKSEPLHVYLSYQVFLQYHSILLCVQDRFPTHV